MRRGQRGLVVDGWRLECSAPCCGGSFGLRCAGARESSWSLSAASHNKSHSGGYMGISDRRNVLKSGLVVLGAGVLADVGALAALQKPSASASQGKAAASGAHGGCNCDHAVDGTLFDVGTSELRPMIERSEVDLRDIMRVYSQPGAAIRRKKLETFYAEQFKLLEATDFDALSQSGKVDYLLFRNNLQHGHKQLEVEDKQDAEIAPLVPYQVEVIGLEEARRRMETLNAQKSAGTLTQLINDIAAAQAGLAKGTKPAATILAHAATRVNQLRGTLRVWFNFYDIYDPQFSWWCDAVYKQADAALGAHLTALLTAAGIAPPEGGDAGGFGGRGGGGRGGGGRGFTVPASTGDTLTGVGPAGRDAPI